MMTVLERRLDINLGEAEQIVQATETRVEEAIGQLRQTLNQVQQQALETAQAASSVLATTATWLTNASLLGLLAAMSGAFAGKPDGFLGDRLDDHF